MASLPRHFTEGAKRELPSRTVRVSFFRVAFQTALNINTLQLHYLIVQFLMVALSNPQLLPWKTIVQYGIKRFTLLAPPSQLLLRNKCPSTTRNQYSGMASSSSIIPADKVSLEEFNRLLVRYQSLIERISDEKGGRLTPQYAL
jgi:hypothetical protein